MTVIATNCQKHNKQLHLFFYAFKTLTQIFCSTHQPILLTSIPPPCIGLQTGLRQELKLILLYLGQYLTYYYHTCQPSPFFWETTWNQIPKGVGFMQTRLKSGYFRVISGWQGHVRSGVLLSQIELLKSWQIWQILTNPSMWKRPMMDVPSTLPYVPIESGNGWHLLDPQPKNLLDCWRKL